ncbi:hypothetical protein J421_4751 (plasmid) [Gemmatirosa kalamazoonensis]|uniref:TonB-dependent receptor plug domain-containing protein n=1 Tax=Gemmatirosa kalamazoonensis TaxID=861299 RepID=W0RNH0_9BACT|nr:hypothetical protein [Gemmatirosa kalamazoonensis]AHG92286.1 hypothetical protein J421_4751 [Gemmatirosa kalamazoonensis]
MSPHRLALFALLVAAPVAARPTAAQDSATKTVKDARPARRDRYLITREELAAPDLQAQSVLEVIRRLRPNFLNVRGTQSCLGVCSANDAESGKVHASVDGNPVVSLSEINTMHIANVTEIRFLDAAAAMQKFGGSAHEGPVILIKTM